MHTCHLHLPREARALWSFATAGSGTIRAIMDLGHPSLRGTGEELSCTMPRDGAAISMFFTQQREPGRALLLANTTISCTQTLISCVPQRKPELHWVILDSPEDHLGNADDTFKSLWLSLHWHTVLHTLFPGDNPASAMTSYLKTVQDSA